MSDIVKKELTAEMLALIEEIDNKIISFSRNKGKIDEDAFRWAFQNAITFEEYLRTFKERLSASATVYAPAALAGVGAKAAKGDTKAAKLIFDMVGALDGTRGNSGSVNMTQVNVSVPSLRDIEEGKIVDG